MFAKKLFVAAVATVVGLSAATAASDVRASGTCEGNACGSVDIAWEGSRYVAHNYDPSRFVILHVEGAAFGWSTDVRVPPGGAVPIFFQTFRLPYRANFQ